MRTKLQEGHVVTCKDFNINEYAPKGQGTVQRVMKAISETNKLGEPKFKIVNGEKVLQRYVIIDVKESAPRITVGNRTSSYENEFLAIELSDDGTYNSLNQKISFTTCGVFSGSIIEKDINIVGMMKKTYVWA